MPQRLRPLQRATLACATVLALVAGGALTAPMASADTKPPTTSTPTTVSTDVLATAQIDGVAWTQTIVGDIVYVGGDFTTARPAGAAAGTGTVPRANVLAYRLSTGQLIAGFAPATNGAVRAITASADGTTIYLGGQFTTVNGSTKAPYLAAVNATDGALVTSFAPKPNGTVRALGLGGSTLYVGGDFTRIGSIARSRAAAVSTAGALQAWAPVLADGRVNALVVNGALGRVVLGGTFSGLNGDTTTTRGSGMVDSANGTTNLPWGVGTKVQDWGSAAAILSLTSDGTNVYGTGYVFGANGDLEGTFSSPWSTGNLRWVEDCHGDTYSSAVLGDAVYVAGHPHACPTVGGFPETNPRSYHRALAFSTAVTGTLGRNTASGYADWSGTPAPSLLTWFPDFNAGTYTGQSQGPWSVAAAGNYVAYAGEFTRVNGRSQQGLVRFAVPAVAPDKDGPQVAAGDLTVSVRNSFFSRTASWTAVWDRDNTSLTYALQRNGVTIATKTVSSQFWSRPSISVNDSSRTSATYQVVVTDPFGNSVTGPVTTG